MVEDTVPLGGLFKGGEDINAPRSSRYFMYYIMSFLFGSKVNPITVCNNATALTTDLGLQQPSPSKLATFVAAADEKEVKKDYVYYEMNDQKTKTFNRKKTSLPSTARQELYKLAPWSVGLDEDDIHVSFEGLTTPDNAKKHSVTVAHNPIHKLKDILKQHRDFYIFFYSSGTFSAAILCFISLLCSVGGGGHPYAWG